MHARDQRWQSGDPASTDRDQRLQARTFGMYENPITSQDIGVQAVCCIGQRTIRVHSCVSDKL